MQIFSDRSEASVVKYFMYTQIFSLVFEGVANNVAEDYFFRLKMPFC
jgi:hypothetical protein